MKKNIVYPDETSPDVVSDLLTRKEFQMYKPVHHNESIIPRFLIRDMIEKGNYLDMSSYQLFVQNYLNPNTTFSRLAIKWETGIGKTVGALSIAMNFINYYQKQDEYMSNELDIGSVYIIGFTQHIFRDELFKFPEFGFISRDEINRLNKMKKLAYQGQAHDIENLKRFNIALKKRLSSRHGNGFFKFIGYKELANHLFIKKDENINIQNITETEIDKFIESGKIKINKTLLESFANSLLICDEIHNTYNSSEKNNWGVAIQTILNYHSSCRAIFLSATPLNNSPTEIVDFLNLLLPRKHYPVIHKKDLFDKDDKLLPGKEKTLATYLLGRVSYIRNRNPEFMASKILLGESIPGIDYLKFIRCPMSELHYNTYKDGGVIGRDGQVLLDMVLPHPDGTGGLYRADEIREKLSSASSDWKMANKITYNEKKDRIGGAFLSLNNIGKYSSKYHQMVVDLLDIIKNKGGKTFIYHNMIHTSGTLMIQEILYQNNIIGEFDNANDSTLCSHCAQPRKKHSKEQLVAVQGGATFRGYNFLYYDQWQRDRFIPKDGQWVIEAYSKEPKLASVCSSVVVMDHIYYIFPRTDTNMDQSDYWTEFITELLKSKTGGAHMYNPVRFVIVHSEIDRKYVHQSLEKFNHVNNTDGSRYMILIGSRIIKESHQTNCVRNLFIMSRPDNIPTLLQIFGRAIRLKSHILLPLDQRNVKLHIYTSAIPGKKQLSHEEERYREKIETYKVIQKIERVMHETAIDAYFNYDTIWQVSEEDKNFGLGILPYKKPSGLKSQELNLSTFNTFYAKTEVHQIMYMIKRLFIEYSSAWKYEDLFKTVTNPPFQVSIDYTLISRNLFNIALHNLLHNVSVHYTEPKINKINEAITFSNLWDKVRNPNDNIFIEQGNTPFLLTKMGEFYLMAPFVNNEMVTDAEVVYRPHTETKSMLVNITDYLVHDMNTNYQEKKIKFIKKWETVSINHLEMAVCDFGVKFHQEFIEEIIEYIFGVWTDPNLTKHEYHNFYLKMLYYYDLQRLISWAHTVNESIKKLYTSYVIPVTTKLLDKNIDIPVVKTEDEESSGFINLLISSINRNNPKWVSTGMIKEYENRLSITNALFEGIYKKSKKPKKVNADLIPVGHFFLQTPRFFIPGEGWKDDPNYSNVDKNLKENPVIIGYDSRSKTGLSIKFKIRSPLQNIKHHSDNRLIEKGALCATKSKSYLKDLAKKLDIKNVGNNVESICQQIRTKLIYYELKERLKKNPVRWFYFVYENNMM
jgi:hypothetical protein